MMMVYLRRDTSAIVDDLAFRQNVETSEKKWKVLSGWYNSLTRRV